VELATFFLHLLCGTIRRCEIIKVTSFQEVEAMVYQKIERIQFLLLQLSCTNGRIEGWI
jgi:hypothetical protein